MRSLSLVRLVPFLFAVASCGPSNPSTPADDAAPDGAAEAAVDAAPDASPPDASQPDVSPPRDAAPDAPRPPDATTPDAAADATADAPAIDGRIETFAFGDGAWCTAIENAAAGDAGRVVLCFDAARGLIGGGAAMASRGIVTAALTFGEAPPPPESAPFETDLDVDVEAVTLVAPGKGKRAPLALTAAADGAQPVAYQISAHAISDDGAGKPAEADQPTLYLRGTAAVTLIEPSGRFRYGFTVEEATATGPGTTPALTPGIATLVGAEVAQLAEQPGLEHVGRPHPHRERRAQVRDRGPGVGRRAGRDEPAAQIVAAHEGRLRSEAFTRASWLLFDMDTSLGIVVTPSDAGRPAAKGASLARPAATVKRAPDATVGGCDRAPRAA